MFETANSHGLVCQNLHTDTSFYRELVSQCVRLGQKQWEIFIQIHTPPHMSKVVHGHVLISQKMVQRYRTQNNKRVEHAAASDGAAVVVVKIDCSPSLFVVSLHGYRGQSSAVVRN